MGILVAFLTLLAPVEAVCEEMDQFTDRLFQIENLTEGLLEPQNPLENRMNQHLVEIEKKLKSRKAKSWQDRIDIMVSEFQHPIPALRELITPYADWIVNDSPIRVFYSTHGRGVYGHEVTYDDMLLAKYVKLAPIIKVAGVLQATDKIGHFLGQGWMYYERYYNLSVEHPQWTQARLFDEVRKFGHVTEKGRLGLETGGVYSYADLASNWQGFVFFVEMFEGNEDKLYFKRDRNGNYKLRRKFTWKDYITDDWDEVQNPSWLPTKQFYGKVVRAFKRKPASAGQSVCDKYNRDRKKYLNSTGRAMRLQDYLWQKGIEEHKSNPYFVDVKTICRKLD